MLFSNLFPTVGFRIITEPRSIQIHQALEATSPPSDADKHCAPPLNFKRNFFEKTPRAVAPSARRQGQSLMPRLPSQSGGAAKASGSRRKSPRKRAFHERELGARTAMSALLLNAGSSSPCAISRRHARRTRSCAAHDTSQVVSSLRPGTESRDQGLR